jgi:hypothetical protein
LTDGQARRQGRFPDGAPNLPWKRKAPFPALLQ